MTIRHTYTKIAFATILLCGFFVAAPAQAALTETQIKAVIDLLVVFNVDPATLSSVDAALRGTSSPGPYVPPAHSGSLSLSRTLSYGSRGEDVAALQRFLAADPSVYPEGQVTGYFGILTQAAVQRYQVKYGIVSSGTPDTTGFGVVGPRTRAHMLAANYDTNPPPPPVQNPTLSIVANPSQVESGGYSLVTWLVQGNYSCSVFGPNGFTGTGLSGAKITGALFADAIYTLTCATPSGQRTATAAVSVNAPIAVPSPSVNPAPGNGATGQSTSSITLFWQNGGNASAYNVYFGTSSSLGGEHYKATQTGTSYTVSNLLPSTTYYWRIDAGNRTGTTTGAVWSFTTRAAPSVVSISANPMSILSGQSSTVTWSSVDASSCSVSGPNFTNVAGASGSRSTGALFATSTYTLLCQTSQGQQSAKVTVGVFAGSGTTTISQTYSNPGTFTYKVPAAFQTLTVKVWGAGGGGAAANYSSGSAGGLSSFTASPAYTLIARGGDGGKEDNQTYKAAGGVGGTASGGTTNIQGENGENALGKPYGGAGGDAPQGGLGGERKTTTGSGNPGAQPGGGGGGSKTSSGSSHGGGGGAGGYTTRIFTPSELPPNTTVQIVVGAGGAPGSGSYSGGRGGNGRVQITGN